MKKVYLLPSAITAFGLACGLFAIFKLFMAPSHMGLFHLLFVSTLLLILAGIADVFDGAVARVIKGESDFGIMFDSLADAISFGVAPAAIFLRSVRLEEGKGIAFFAIAGAMLFVISGVMRLARYNVKALSIKGNSKELEAAKKNFTGFPIPAAAGCAISAVLFLHAPQTEEWFVLSDTSKVWILGTVFIAIGYLMVSNIKFLSLKRLKVSVPSFPLLLTTVIVAMAILYGLFYHFSLVILLISWLYLLLGCVLTLIRLIAGRKSKTLVDFEPEHDEIE